MAELFRSTFRYQGKKYERKSTVSQREADRKADKLKRDLENGIIGISSNMTVKRWAQEYLETYKKPMLAQKSYEDYQMMFNNTILPAIGAMRLTDVKDIHLQKLLNSYVGYSFSRMSKLRNMVKALFEQAKVSRLIHHNPADYITMPHAPAGTHRCITEHERACFLNAAKTHYAGLMFKVMLYCGLRTGEVAALDWRDIDTEKRRLKVTKSVESGTSNIKAPKTAAGVRDVPIPDVLFDELMAVKGNPFEPMFLQPRGGIRHTHSSRRTAWASLKRQMNASMGVLAVADDFVPYCLRHTYCTDLQDAGVPINIAKYLMGHSDIKVTASIYTHTTEQSIDDAACLINGGSAGGRNSKHAGNFASLKGKSV